MNNDVKFIKGQGGLVRPLAGKDHYTGLVFYAMPLTEAPTGWTYGTPQQVFSLADLEVKNITATTAAFKTLHYQVSEFFRINPGASLWVVLQVLTTDGEEPPVTLAPDYAEVTALLQTQPDIRQVGVQLNMEFNPGMVTALQAIAAETELAHKPVHLFLQPKWGVIDIGTLTDLRTLTAPKVSVCIAEDTTTRIEELRLAGYNPGCIGTVLGLVSKAQVNECIGWVGKFDISGAAGIWDIPALGDGVKIKTLTDTQIDTLNSKGYLVAVKRVGLSGTWFYDSPTCVTETSDYAYIENNRTIDKAIRGMYTYLLPEINSPVMVSADGKLTPDYVKYLESVAGRALTEMERNAELSAWKVMIDPDQNVLSTSKLMVSVVLVPVGVSRVIEVTIGFGLSV